MMMSESWLLLSVSAMRLPHPCPIAAVLVRVEALLAEAADEGVGADLEPDATVEVRLHEQRMQVRERAQPVGGGIAALRRQRCEMGGEQVAGLPQPTGRLRGSLGPAGLVRIEDD